MNENEKNTRKTQLLKLSVINAEENLENEWEEFQG
jgi:hypothetical protein